MKIKKKSLYTITLTESELKNIDSALKYKLEFATLYEIDKEELQYMIDSITRKELLK